MIPTPIQSVRILPVPNTITWDQSLYSTRSLVKVNLDTTIDVDNYKNRDTQLYFRDVLIATLAVKLGAYANEVFNTNISNIRVESKVEDTLNIATETAIDTTGKVTFVNSLSVPKDALLPDAQLFNRDIILYQVLASISQVFPSYTLPYLISNLDIGDVLASGIASATSSSPNPVLPLNTDLFNYSDFNLVYRDNIISSNLAKLAYTLNNIYENAHRLLVQLGENYPEFYNLISSDSDTRVFAVEPLLPDRNKIVYNIKSRTLNWVEENYETSGTVPFNSSLSVTSSIGENLEVIPDNQELKDSEFYRQKASRLYLSSYTSQNYYTENNIVSIIAPNYANSGVLLNPDSTITLSSNNSTVNLIPNIDEVFTGDYKVSLLIQYSKYSYLYGAYNNNNILPDNSVSATIYSPEFLPSASSLSWSLTLTPGIFTLNFEYSEKSANNLAARFFSTEVLWNNSVVFSGNLVYGVTPGTVQLSNSFNINSDGTNGVLTLRRLDSNVNGLSIGRVSIQNINKSSILTDMTVGIADQTSESITIGADTQIATLSYNLSQVTPSLITLTLNKITGSINIKQVNIKRYTNETQTQKAANFAKYKREYTNKALQSVISAFHIITAVPSSVSGIDYNRILNPVIWDSIAMEQWIDLIAVYEPRIRQAFRPGVAGDVGFPALVPSNIYFNSATNQALPLNSGIIGFPTLQTFQPWMVNSGVYVFQEDFWIYNLNLVDIINAPLVPPLNADFTVTSV